MQTAQEQGIETKWANQSPAESLEDITEVSVLPLAAEYFEDMSRYVSVYATSQSRDSSQDYRK